MKLPKNKTLSHYAIKINMKKKNEQREIKTDECFKKSSQKRRIASKQTSNAIEVELRKADDEKLIQR